MTIFLHVILNQAFLFIFYCYLDITKTNPLIKLFLKCFFDSFSQSTWPMGSLSILSITPPGGEFKWRPLILLSMYSTYSVVYPVTQE